MKFLITLCMCVGLSAAQQYYPQQQGSAPSIPGPATYGGSPSYGAPAPAAAPAAYNSGAYVKPSFEQSGLYNPQAYSQARAPAAPQYAPSAPVARHNPIPSQYNWNVQHSAPAPAPVPQAQSPVIPTQSPVAPQYQQYAAPQPQQYAPQQYSPQQYAAPQPQPTRSYAQPAAPAAPAYSPQAPTNPISALARPASVHYANIGETLSGDYKFGYRTGNGDSYREETRAPDGTVNGQYGYTGADGKERIVKYSAGVGGFQILNDAAAPAQAPAAQAAPAVPQWAQQSSPAPQQYQNYGSPQQAAPQQQWG